MTRISTIIFDQGEVLFTNDWDFDCPEKDERFYEYYDLTPKVFWPARKKHIDDLFRGKISEVDYWNQVLRDAGAITTDPSFAISLAREYQQWKPRMKQLIIELKELGLRLAIISTTHKEMIVYKINAFGLRQYFDPIVTSCQAPLFVDMDSK